jgi:hypothetical protein
MPKRSNSFQRLIYHIQRQLAGQSTVTESKFLRDRVTLQEREVDVVIESKIGDYELIIGIECNASGRKATVEWVERMIGKHKDLPTNQLVLISQAGFSKASEKKALLSGARTYSLGRAIEADWTEIVGKLGTLFFARFEFTLTSVEVAVERGPGTYLEISPGQEFISSTGEPHTSSTLVRISGDGSGQRGWREARELRGPSSRCLVRR